MGKWLIGLVMGVAALGGVFLLWKQQAAQSSAGAAAEVAELSPPAPASGEAPAAPDSTSASAPDSGAAPQTVADSAAPEAAKPSTASAEGIIVVDDPWAQPAPAGHAAADAYMLFTNTSQTPDRIVAVSSPDSDEAAIQDTVAYANGSATRPAAHADLDPGVPLVFEPGGLHVALIGLKHPIKNGDSLTLVFSFAHAGTLKVKVPVGEQPSLTDGIQP
jgi:copper(I)-binding protein